MDKMSRQEEDTLMEIYLEVEKKGLREKFDKQLKKMRNQDKHQYKDTRAKWTYTLNKVKKSNQ